MVGNNPEAELASVKTELRLISKSLDEVKAALHEMSNLGGVLTQIASNQKAYEQKVLEVGTRLDTLESRQNANTAFLNKIRGSVTTSAWIARAVQAALIGAVGWIYTTMADTREQVIETAHHVQFLEREHQQIIQELAKEARK